MTRRRPFLDLPLVLLIVPPVLYAVGALALAVIDLPPMPWGTAR